MKGHFTDATFELIVAERVKQRQKFGDEPLADDTAFMRIALEEFGEFAKALNQGNAEQAKKELVQLTAVCVAHLDGDLHDGKAA